jgi:hypothetical protein
MANIDKLKRTGGSRYQALGTARLRHQETQEILLIPQPPDEPTDPLNW